MGLGDGVQRVLKTGVASADDHGIAIAVWKRSGRAFAEGRVFARDSSPEAKRIIDTLEVEADTSKLAVVLLEMKIEEKYGLLNQIQWRPTVGAAIEVAPRTRKPLSKLSAAAVRAGDDLEEVTVGIFEVNAAAAVIAVDFASAVLAGVGPVLQASLADAAEDRVEIVFT